MKNTRLEIVSNENIALRTWKMVLRGDDFSSCCPGQFVELAVEGKFLRRPFSICDASKESLTLIYKVVGGGTGIMSALKPGSQMEGLFPLGKGFNLSSCAGRRGVLIGGGLGAAPLHFLARRLVEAGIRPEVVLGFNTAEEIFLEREFVALGLGCTVTTVDGSRGVKGLVTDALRGDCDYFYTCGPMVMMKAVCAALPGCGGEVSLEERMGCGCGICYGCTCHTSDGPKRVCADGPVFKKEDVIW